MRVVFLGFATWGVTTLKGLLQAGHDVSLVITHPESNHEYEIIWNDSVSRFAATHGIPTKTCVYANTDEIAHAISQAQPDLMVSSDWRTWLSPEILKLPKCGSINIHDALLPKYGGFAPINWAIINGESETGVTVHFIENEFDLGNIILQERVPINFSDTATDIFHKTLPLFSTLPVEALRLIESGQLLSIPQDRTMASFYHKRSERDSLIDWNKSNIQIHNLVRAQSDPYPNAYTYLSGKKLKVKKASLPDRSYCGTPGRVFCRGKNGVVVVCGSNKEGHFQGLVVELVQGENEEAIKANEYFKKMGDYLG